ncbi:MAG: VanZ family protein [Chloroflexota bacterium]|nr:VanZ family protein [Chloroflexota bacterium]
MSPPKRKLDDTWLSRWLPVAVWAALIFAVSSRSSLPSIGGGRGFPVSQAGHLSEYAILALLLFRALGSRKATAASLGKMALLCLGLSIVYGLSDEFHQSLVPNRDSSLVDVATDSVGAAVALLVAVAWHRWRVRARG